MKERIAVLALVLGIMAARGVSAQGQPVIDITAIIAAIDNGYTMVHQLQAMYDTLKTNYDQLQQQMKSFESFDFNALDAKDPLGSWRSLTTYADRMSTYEQNIASIINKKDIKIGSASYSLGDIYISPAADALKDSGAIDPFEKMLSPEDGAIFVRKFGMSYGNYMRISQIKEILQKKAAEVAGYSDNLRLSLEEDRERLSAITKDLYGSESTIQQQQINNAVLSIMAQDIKTQANLLGSIASQLAASEAQAQAEKQARQDELNINSLDITDGILQMLEKMPPESEYR